MAKGVIVTTKRYNTLTRKQRVQHNSHNHSVGFPTGFTRALLKQLHRARMRSLNTNEKLTKLVMRKGDLRKKIIKQKYKKVSEKSRLAAHAARMKKLGRRK